MKRQRLEQSKLRTIVTLAAMAVAVACIVIAAKGDALFLVPVLLVNGAGAVLWKYVPLAAGIPGLAAALASVPSGQPETYLYPGILFEILGGLRHFKVLPGGWSEP